MLKSGEMGYWITLFIAINGVGNNCLLLSLAYRLKWHKCVHYTLIINQATIDMLSALVGTVAAFYWLMCLYFDISSIISQKNCLALFVPVCVLATCGQKSDLMVAIDRLINVLRPHWWIKSRIWYRLVLMAIAIIWAIVQETGWLFFLGQDICVDICCTYTSYPYVQSWSTLVTVGDMVTGGLVVVAYLVIPPLSGTMIRKLSCGSLIVKLDDMEREQRRIVKCVRRLSVLTAASFFVSIFLGFFFTDITALFRIQKEELEFKAQLLGNALSMLNTVLPLYLFLWKTKTFRARHTTI